MGASPKQEVKKKQRKFAMTVTYTTNGASRGQRRVRGLDAPTEGEALKALYRELAAGQRYEIIEIHPSTVSSYEE